MKLDVTSRLFKVQPAQFPSHLIKARRLFSNRSHVSCLIYGAASVGCYSSVIFSTALFLQPTANPSPSPGRRTIFNQILRSEIPSNCQTPFLILSTPPPPPSRLLGNSSALRLQIITDLVQNQFHLQHHVFSIMPFLFRIFFAFMCVYIYFFFLQLINGKAMCCFIFMYRNEQKNCCLKMLNNIRMNLTNVKLLFLL